MAATSFGDCVRFAQSVTSIGGTLPKRLQGLLSGWEVLNAPAAAGRRQDDPIVDACLTGTLSAEKLAELLPAAAGAALGQPVPGRAWPQHRKHADRRMAQAAQGRRS